jgi:RimJ/RimL family protein N-acetyltransferase
MTVTAATVFEAPLGGGATARFRRLDPRADLDLVHGWMHQPHVIPFWRLDVSEAEIAAYLEGVLASGHAEPLIGSVDATPVSYWEVYWAARDPLAAHYAAEEFDQGVHLLVGPLELTGRGLGRRLLDAVVGWQLDREPRTRRIVAEPDVRNRRMIHVFERCGFVREAEVDLPDKRAALMVRSR